MPRDALHLLSFSPQEGRYTITLDSLSLSPEITLSRRAWQEWLDTVASFAFENRLGGHCTIRKERLQRGDVYWYAYRSIRGHTKKRYLGRTADLSFERLEEISALFTTEDRETHQLPAAGRRRSASGAGTLQTAIRRENVPALTPLLETKLHPPQLPALLVERTRLLARLDDSFSHKLTLLQAPAGFGKTTLINQWLATRGTSPVLPAAALAWVSLDAGDNDPLRFWRYVMTACQALLEPKQRVLGPAALALLTAAMRSLFEPLPMEMALTRLLNDLAEPSSGGLLVLDDYHAITEPRIHEALAFLIDHLPATVHVLLLSRSEPSLPLLRWRAKGELCELHGTDLRFSLEETDAFIQQALPITLSEAALTRLDASLEGWVAGLRLLSLTLSGWRTSQAIEQALLSLGEHAGISSLHRSLLEYLVIEILETQPEPVQRFLLQTSVLSRLCGPLCDAVSGEEGGAAQLETIRRAGLFLEALEGPVGWYRYHALFAEALRREASRRLGEEALRSFSLKASQWYEQEALLTEAIDAALLARDMEQAAKLIELIVIQNFYELQTLLRWLEQLPEAVLNEHPLLCHFFAVELRFPVELRFAQIEIPVSSVPAISEAKRSRIETLLQMAEAGWRRQGMQSWIGANWGFRALSSLLDAEPFSVLVHYAQQALVFLPQEEELDRRLQMYRSSCLLFVGIEKLRIGRVGEARQQLLQAQRDNTAPNRFLAADIDLTLGKSYLIQGELQQAKRYYRQALADARELHDYEVTADALLELSWLAFERDDLTGAEQQSREALELAQDVYPQRRGLHDRAALQFALLRYARGETDAALEQLSALLAEQPGEWTPSSFWLFSRLRYWQGRLRIATGDLQAVQESLQASSQSSGSVSITEQLGEQILWGRLLLAQGDAQAALEQFAHLLPMAQEQLHQYVALEIQLLLALAHAACKQEQQAHYWLRHTLLQAVHEGYIRLFLNEGRPLVLLLRSLLPTVQHDAALRSYVQMTLRAATQRAGSRRVSLSSSHGLLYEPLSVQEQRVLRLLAAGWSNQDIARELVVSINTVKYHVKHLYQKLGVSNRLQASEVARHLQPGEPL
ncbi:MAG: tetratricopeptide repeat protein [Ktedonobacteraceae bacterium]|nr:tetratricopeptide repeat protein [Ktedonobacteraceae bacterium]